MRTNIVKGPNLLHQHIKGAQFAGDNIFKAKICRQPLANKDDNTFDILSGKSRIIVFKRLGGPFIFFDEKVIEYKGENLSKFRII